MNGKFWDWKLMFSKKVFFLLKCYYHYYTTTTNITIAATATTTIMRLRTDTHKTEQINNQTNRVLY